MQVNSPSVYHRMYSVPFVDAELVTLPWIVTLFTFEFGQQPLLDTYNRDRFLLTAFTLMCFDGSKAILKICLCLLNNQSVGR